MSGGACLSWALATAAIAHKLDVMPLPPGTSEAECGRWRLVVNNSRFELSHRAAGKPDVKLPPFEVYCEHLDFISFGLLGPGGGLIGGCGEEQFIGDMIAYLPTSALEPWREDLAYRKEFMQ